MINSKIAFRSAFLFISSIVTSTSVLAGLEQTVFTDTTGTQQSIVGDELTFTSINSDVQLYISSGLDRKLQVQLVDSAGLVIQEVNTSVINVSDRISVGDNDYYGKIISLKAPNADGSFTFIIISKDLSGNVTSTSSYEFTQDTTAPSITGEFTLTNNAYHGTIDNFGTTNTTKQLNVSGVSDLNGIDHVRYWVEQPDKSKKYADVQYNADSQKVVIAGSIATSKSLVPEPGYYQIGVDVYDAANNVATKSRYSHIDLTCPTTDHDLTQVYNDKTGEWETYSSGMKIFANPVKVRYRRNLSDFATAEAPYGWKIGDGISYKDSDYAYYERTFPYKQAYTYFNFFSESGHACRTYRLRNFNFTLASGVDLAPVSTGLAYQTNLSSEWVNSETFRTAEEATITKVRLFSEARSYRQKRTLNGGGSCYVEIGSTYCDISTSYSRSSGRGYSPYAYYASKDDDSMKVHSSYLYTYWDFNSPVISSLKQDASNKTIQMNTYDADTTSDWKSSMWVISSVGATANINGDSVKLNSPSLNTVDYQHREYTFNTSSLDVEGEVPITFYVEDSYGNRTEQTETYLIDSVEPAIAVTYKNETPPEVIGDIRNFVINVEDYSSASLKSVQLTGSNAEENVYLAIVDEGNGNYSVEKPRIFPTLDYGSGERYKLSMVAVDEYGNTQRKTIEFGYSPDNLIVIDSQTYLPANGIALYDVNDNAIASIYSQEILTLDSSQVATGEQQAEITNRKDSDFTIIVKGNQGIVTVEPGVTKSMTIDLGTAGGKLDVEVYPADNTEGTAEFMFDIPTLTTIY